MFRLFSAKNALGGMEIFGRIFPVVLSPSRKSDSLKSISCKSLFQI